MNWNDKGELEYNGIVMPDTNIADLVANSVKKRKKSGNNPEGYDTFLKAMKTIRVPTNVINAEDATGSHTSCNFLSKEKKIYQEKQTLAFS